MTEDTGFTEPGIELDLGLPPKEPSLSDLLNKQVTITNPDNGSSWTGRMLGYGSTPCVSIEQADGFRLCLPQYFTITEAPPDVQITVSREDVRTVLRCGKFGLDEIAAADRLAAAVRTAQLTLPTCTCPDGCDLEHG